MEAACARLTRERVMCIRVGLYQKDSAVTLDVPATDRPGLRVSNAPKSITGRHIRVIRVVKVYC